MNPKLDHQGLSLNDFAGFAPHAVLVSRVIPIPPHDSEPRARDCESRVILPDTIQIPFGNRSVRFHTH
jgi:hypothetical protein